MGRPTTTRPLEPPAGVTKCTVRRSNQNDMMQSKSLWAPPEPSSPWRARYFLQAWTPQVKNKSPAGDKLNSCSVDTARSAGASELDDTR